MQASLMGCALESYLIDNDMLGAILKSLSPIEVSETTLALGAIDEVVHGEGHFLGQPETLQRMQSDFVYPQIGDRRSIEDWQADGARDIREVARDRHGKFCSSTTHAICLLKQTSACASVSTFDYPERL